MEVIAREAERKWRAGRSATLRAVTCLPIDEIKATFGCERRNGMSKNKRPNGRRRNGCKLNARKSLQKPTLFSYSGRATLPRNSGAKNPKSSSANRKIGMRPLKARGKHHSARNEATF